MYVLNNKLKIEKQAKGLWYPRQEAMLALINIKKNNEEQNEKKMRYSTGIVRK